MSDQNENKIDETFATNVNIKKYENVFVGFEFEYNGGLSAGTVADHFNLDKVGKTDGKGKKKVRKTFGDGEVNLDVDVDRYKELPLVTQVYHDGSVDNEVVTRPVRISELSDVKERVFDYLREGNSDMVANGDAGLHMTVLLNHHKEKSSWDKIVAQNIIQVVRCYYKEILKLLSVEGERGVKYRSLPSLYHMKHLNDSHSDYNAVATKKDDSGNVWGLEFRFPDGTNDWEDVKRMVKFVQALIRFSAKLSRAGRLQFSQETFDEQKNFQSEYRYNGVPQTDELTKRQRELLQMMEKDLDFYGFTREDELPDDLERKVTELVVKGESKSSIYRKMKDEGYKSKKINQTIRKFMKTS